MNRKQSSWLAFSLLTLGQFVGGAFVARASDFDLRSTAATNTDAMGSGDGGEGLIARRKINFTFDARIGYDDNTLSQPDTTVSFTNVAGKKVKRDVDGGNSVFFNFDLGASYIASTSRSTLTIGADAGISYFLDRPGKDYDINGALTAQFAYKLAPRFFLELSTFNSYVPQGDFGASNLTNFNGSATAGVNTPGTTDDRNGDYFFTSDSLQLTFQAAPRYSFVSGYGITAFAYEDSFYSRIDDRVEQYFSEEFRFLLQPQLTLTADYRLGVVTYFGVDNDSITHFVLAGFDYLINPRLRASVRAGVEFRQYTTAVGDETSPYAEGTITYDLGRRINVSLVARYGIEEGGLTSDATNSNTFRIGLSYNQQFTARINGYMSFYYTHSYLQTPSGNVPSFNEDSFDVAVGARYALSRNLALEAGYTHTTVTSQVEVREYDRNRVFAGVRLSF